LPNDLTAAALEVDAGRVEENDAQVDEEVSSPREQQFLNAVLDAARREWRGQCLLLAFNRFAEPSHHPVEMVQFQPLDSVDGIAPTPFSMSRTI
jgi:hypothetical protein